MSNLEFCITHDGVRYLAEATSNTEELPRKYKSDIRDILKDGTLKFEEDGTEYINVNIENLHNKLGEQPIGIVEFNKIEGVYNIKLYNSILADFGNEL